MNAPQLFVRNPIITVLGACFLGGAALLQAAPTELPELSIEPVPEGLRITWDDTLAQDYILQQTDDLATWTDVILSITQDEPTRINQVLVPTTMIARMYRLHDDEDPMTKQPAYVGSSTCGQSGCHSDRLAETTNTGHPYKLNKVVGGVAPTYFDPPQTNVLTPPVGMTWNDIGWVIGGAIWKARFIGHDGYIITSTPAAPDDDLVQYNLQTDGWVTYHQDEVEKPYNCGACHTTGWVSTGDGSVNQDAAPGMHGTYTETGIRCEACHGPGSRHVNTPTGSQRKDEIVIDTSASLCGSCHVRGAIDTIPASGGPSGDFTDTFIRHHEQYNELLASPGHSGHDCVTCHDPHLSVKLVGKNDANYGIHTACTDCHNDTPQHAEGTIQHDFAANFHTTEGFADCVDCHMPRAGKSAVAVNTYTGDIKTHIFTINPLAAGTMFEEDMAGKKWVALDGSGKSAGVTLDFVCYQCHYDPSGVGGGLGEDPKTLSELEGTAVNYHNIPPP